MDGDRMLNLYIFDYCRKRNYTATALCFYNEVLASDPSSSSSSSSQPPTDTSSNPGGGTPTAAHPRVSEFSQIPPVSIPIDSPDGGFLYEWWTVFWDMFKARTMSGGSREALVFFEHQTKKAQLEKEQRLLQLQMQSQAAMSAANGSGGSMPGQPGSVSGTPPNAHVPMPGMPAAAAMQHQQQQHGMVQAQAQAQAHAQQMAMTRAQSVMSNAGNPPTPAQVPLHLINGQLQQQATGGAGGAGNPGQVIMRPDGTLAIQQQQQQQQGGAPGQPGGMYAPGATPGSMTPQAMAQSLPIQAHLQQQQQPAAPGDTASSNSQPAGSGGAINSSAVISPQLQTALFTQAMTELGFNGRDTKTLTDDEKSRVLANMQARLSKLTASGTPLSVLNQQVIGAQQQQQQGGVRPPMPQGQMQQQQQQAQMQMQMQMQQQQHLQQMQQMQSGVRPPQMQGQPQAMMAPPGMIPGGPGQPPQPIPGQSPQLAQQRLAIQHQQAANSAAAAAAQQQQAAGRMRQGNSVGPMSAPTPPPADQQQPGQQQAPTRKRQRNDGTFTMSPSPTMAHAQLFAHQQQVVQGANAALQQQIAAQQQQQQQQQAMAMQQQQAQQQQGGTPVANQLTGTPQLMSPPPQGNPVGPPPPGGGGGGGVVSANGTGVTQATLQQLGALPFIIPPGMNQAQVQALQQRHTRYEQLIVQAKLNNVQLSQFEQNMLREHHKFLEQAHVQMRGGVPLTPGQGGMMSPQMQQQQQQQMAMMQAQQGQQPGGQQAMMQMQQQQALAMQQQQAGAGVRPPQQMPPGMMQQQPFPASPALNGASAAAAAAQQPLAGPAVPQQQHPPNPAPSAASLTSAPPATGTTPAPGAGGANPLSANTLFGVPGGDMDALQMFMDNDDLTGFLDNVGDIFDTPGMSGGLEGGAGGGNGGAGPGGAGGAAGGPGSGANGSSALALRAALSGQQNKLVACDVHAMGKMLVSGSQDRKVIVWSVRGAGSEVSVDLHCVLENFGGQLTCLRFAGDHLLTTGFDQLVRAYRVKDPRAAASGGGAGDGGGSSEAGGASGALELESSFNVSAAPTGVDQVAGNVICVVDGEGMFRVFDRVQGSLLGQVSLLTVVAGNGGNKPAYSPNPLRACPLDGSRTVAVALSQWILLVDVPPVGVALGSDHVRAVKTSHIKNIHSIDWSRDGSLLLTACEDRVVVWDAATKSTLVTTTAQGGKVTAAAFAPASTPGQSPNKVVFGEYENLYLWTFRGGAAGATAAAAPAGSSSKPVCLKGVHPGGNVAAIASALDADDGSVVVVTAGACKEQDLKVWTLPSDS